MHDARGAVHNVSMRAVLVLVTLAALAVVAWLLQATSDSGPRGAATPAVAADEPRAAEAMSTGAASAAVERREVPIGASSSASLAGADDSRLTLRVRVKDAAGQAIARVPVRADLSALEAGRTETRPTGKDGIATFPLPAKAREPLHGAIVVALELPTFEPVRGEAPVALIVRNEPFELVLPPLGVLAVNLVQLDGTPFTGPNLRLELRPLAPEETLQDAARHQGVTQLASDGGAEFAFVPLHSAFALIPHAAGLHSSFAPVRVIGPTAIGQRLEVTLREDATRACVVIRLVDAARAPLGDTQVRIDLRESVQVGGSSGITSTGMNQTTDAAGELRLWFDAAGSKDRTRRLAFALHQRPEVCGTLAIDHALPPGVTHLGDVVLDELRTVALAGRVIDESDEPVAQARIQVARLSRTPGGGQARWSIGDDAQSGDDGAFAIKLAAAADTEFGVSAAKPGYLTEKAVEARYGAADLILRVRRAGSITGSLAFDADALGRIGIRVVEPDGRRGHEAMLDRQAATFARDGLAGGTYAVEMTLSGFCRPWLRVADVIVVAGQATADPRLQDVALPAGLRRVRVLVQDSAGRPLADALVRADEPAGPSTRIHLRRHGSDGVTMLVRPGTALIAGAPGLRSQTFTVTDDTHTVRLLPGIPLRVSVVGDYARAHPDLTLAVAAHPVGRDRVSYLLDGGDSSTSGSTHGLDSLLVGLAELAPRTTSTVVHLPRPGEWRVGLQAIATSGTMRVAVEIPGDARKEVLVGEGGAEVSLPLSATAVSAALNR